MIPGAAKAAVRAFLALGGYRVQRLSPDEERFRDGYDDRVPLPPGAEEILRPDYPGLVDLQQRYASINSAVCTHTQWSRELRTQSRDLRYFRGENAYLWSYLQLNGRMESPEHMRCRYYVYAQYIRGLDRLGLLGGPLTEDAQFGCFAFRYPEMPSVSRDLLDSINELYFLDRHWNLFRRNEACLLDIGAGYGRLAHRMLAAAPGVNRYWCVDAIPRSTFLCEYYLKYRGLAGSANSRAVVLPLDEMGTLVTGDVDLAVNIHSFSEMGYAAIEGWMRWLASLNVPTFLLVPNEPQMLSREVDGSRREYRPLIEAAGYKLEVTEPTVRDRDVAGLFGTADHFFLFRRN